MVTIALENIKSVEELIALLERESEVVLKKDDGEIKLTVQTTTQETQPSSGERIFGFTKGTFIYGDDLMDPLPDELWDEDDEYFT